MEALGKHWGPIKTWFETFTIRGALVNKFEFLRDTCKVKWCIVVQK